MHTKKTELERTLQMKERKRKTVESKALEEPMNRWDELTKQEKHEIASAIIDVIYINHYNTDVEINFSIRKQRKYA